MHSWRESRFDFVPIVFNVALLLAAAPLHAQIPDSNDGPLQATHDVPRAKLIGNDTILRMHAAGLGDDVLLQTIQLQPGHYDTTPDDLIALKTAGLSDKVISALQAHGTGLNVRGDRAPNNDVPTLHRVGPVPQHVAPSPFALGIDEIGVYYRLHPKDSQPGEWIQLHTERVVFKSSGAVKNILSDGLLKKDMNGRIDGPKSDLVLPTGVELLIYAPTGTDGNEYDFLRLEEHKDSREFRTLTAGIFNSQSGAGRDELEFHPTRLGPQMYTFTVPINIEKGEYGVLPPGSANTQGIAGTGKIFTFSIRE